MTVPIIGSLKVAYDTVLLSDVLRKSSPIQKQLFFPSLNESSLKSSFNFIETSDTLLGRRTKAKIT